MGNIRSFKELRVWNAAFELAVQIHELSFTFPATEKYALTDQIRRSSRSVAANISEAWRKRRYPASFIAKLSDAEAEAAETQTWLQFCLRFGYIESNLADQMDRDYEAIMSQLVAMATDPDSWTIRPSNPSPRVPTSQRPSVSPASSPRVPASPRPSVSPNPSPRVPASQRPSVSPNPGPRVSAS